jgi:predicted nucleic acid-binding protein
VSGHILDELRRTLATPYFSRTLSAQDQAEALELLATDAILIPLTIQVVGVATHPEGDLILATAVSAGADYLVTGDSKLQNLGSYQGVTIVSPREFLELLDQETG